MKKLLALAVALTLAHSAHAAVQYSLSVQNPPISPNATWWGSFAAVVDGYIDGPVSLTVAEREFTY